MVLMKSLLLDHWPRKLASFVMALIIWISINHSMVISKTLYHVPVRILHLPDDQSVEGMQLDGTLNKRLMLNVVGNKSSIEDLTGKEVEVVIDAAGKPQEWVATVNEKNLLSLNSRLDLSKAITRVEPVELIVKKSKRVTEKIPILLTPPIGESPKGYQFLDVWPYHLFLTVTGPEDSIKQLKARGLKLTFNLSDISKEELDALTAEREDEVSFFVPAAWKKINLPFLSDVPIEIDDPQARFLRMDFSKEELLPIDFSIPVTIFFPPKNSPTLNPDTYSLLNNEFITKKNGIKTVAVPLYAHGVSRLFLESVKDMMQMVIVAAPESERNQLLWSVQFIYPHALEDRYVARALAESPEGIREDYLRNRFRNYMHRFRLYTAQKKKLSLQIELQANSISVNAHS